MCKELNKHNNVKLIILSSFQNVARPIFNDVTFQEASPNT